MSALSTGSVFATPVSETEKDMIIIADRMRKELIDPASPIRRGGRGQESQEERIHRYIQEQDPNGSWPDINYQDRARTRWVPGNHTNQLVSLARAYRTIQSEFYGDSELKQAIIAGLSFWVDQDPQSDNWWRNCIDTPLKLGQVLLLMEADISDALIEKTAPIIRRSSFTRTGANLIWESSSLLVLACVTNDHELFKEAAKHISSEVRITTDEGIQPDFSYHQHGPQLYINNYGRIFSSYNSRYAALFANTSVAFTSEKIHALSGLVREGQQWFLWGQQYDYHALGRRIDQGSDIWNGRGFARISRQMAIADPENAEEYENFTARLTGEQQAGETGPKGNKHFWRSDTMIHRPGHFYTSVRMHSKRTHATEINVNWENLKGYHLSDGAYFLMQRGDEYHNIQPTWDWRKLPGVTFKETDATLPYGDDIKQTGNTDFVGGVSNGIIGAAAMDYAKEDVRARKAWFFFNKGWVCLGAGISSETNERVSTSVNQCLLKSEVTLLRDGKLTAHNGQELRADDLQGIHHDGVGYALLETQPAVLRTAPQTGTWTSLEERSTRREPVTHDVFNLWIDHGPRPENGEYAYMLIPGVTPEVFSEFVQNPPIRILANQSNLQAVYLEEEQTIQAAFYQAGSIVLDSHTTLQVEQPCLVMLKLEKDTITLSVADPTQTLKQVQLSLSGSYIAEGCTIHTNTKRTTLTADLPLSAYAGRTIQLELHRKE